MSLVRALLIFVLGAAAALGASYALRDDRPQEVSQAAPTVPANLPDDPGDPPVTWLEGVIEELQPSHLELREGQGPTIDVRRFAQGATTFLGQEAGRWRELTTAEVDGLDLGRQVCVETLLDGRTFFALRVFVGARCGPM